MMTLKVWNTLAPETRKEIVNKCGYTASAELLQPYHHNFDYDGIGKRLKRILECCYLRPSDKKIVVSIEVTPKYEAEKKPAKKSAKAAIKTPSKPQEQKRYKFRRYTQDDPDDGEWVWCYACSEQEARNYLEGEYWDTVRLVFYGTF